MSVQCVLSAEGAASLGCFSRWNPPSSTLLAQGLARLVRCSSCPTDKLIQVTRTCVLQVAREAQASAEEQLAAAKEEICQLSTQQEAAYAARVADLEWALQVGPCMSGVSWVRAVQCLQGQDGLQESLLGVHALKQTRHNAPREGT